MKSKLEMLKDTMRVESVTSSFSHEVRKGGIKSSSFVAYTVKCEDSNGWDMEEARMVQAILAERVSKDLYADLGTRQIVDMKEIVHQQQQVTQNYQRLQENLQNAYEAKVDTKRLVEVAMESRNGR